MYETTCKCINQPLKGNFVKGETYECVTTLRGKSVEDSSCKRWPYSELDFLAFFREIGAEAV